MKLPDVVFNFFFTLIEVTARGAYKKGRLAAKGEKAPDFILPPSLKLRIKTEYNKEFNNENGQSPRR